MADYTLSAKITGDSKGFEKAFSTAEKTVATFEGRMKNIGSKLEKIGSGLEGLGNGISGFGKKLTVVTAGLGTAGAAGVKYNATVEQLQTSFEVMTGSAEDAADIVSQLQKIGAETPFEFTDLANTTQLLMNFGFTADKSIESMQMLGDISQGSSEKMGSIARAYGKMSSASKVSLEDINMMIDAGFNPLQEISDTTGESMSSLYNRISKGSISVDEITASMQRSTSEGGKYFQSMEKQSETFSGQMSTLSDNVDTFLGNVTGEIFDTIAQDILPKLNDAISAINDGFASGGFQGAIDAIREMSPVLDNLIGKIEVVSGALERIGIDPAMFAGAAAAAGPLLVVFGKVVSVSGTAVGGIGKITGAIGSFVGKISALGGMKGAISAVFTALTSPIGVVVLAIGALVAAFAYLMTTNDGFRESIMSTVSTIMASLQPVLSTLMSLLTEIGGILLGIIGNILQQLAPVLAQIIGFIGEIVASIAPLIVQLIDSVAPIVTTIMTMVSEIISSLMPPLIAIIGIVMEVVESLIPPTQRVLSVAIEVISSLVSAISPIIGIIADTVSSVISIIAPIVTFIANVITEIINFVSPIVEVSAAICEGIFSVVSSVFGEIGSFIENIFNKVEESWDGLKGFVSGIFDGISSAFDALVGVVKGVINGVIGAINGAIWVINLIPGVEIGEIPYLAHGTDNWQGGFAYMNEGGRGELTYLPNGAQVIPHDISVKYAKEAARANTKGSGDIDLSGLMEGVVIQVINHTNVDGTPLKETVSDYTIRKIGNQQQGMRRARGAYGVV